MTPKSEEQTYLVVMAGGSGTRFWPKSTSKRPKQLMTLDARSDRTLLEQTLERFTGWIPSHQQMIVTSRSLEEAVQEQAHGARVLAEPQARNTAPCVYWAAKVLSEVDPDAVMIVVPADHYIARMDDYLKAMKKAVAHARESDDLVTLGIQPDRPETGYGYLRLGQQSKDGARAVEAFVEKPDLQKAKDYLASNDYFWNAGMFIWKASAILQAFDRFMPEMSGAWEKSQGDIDQAYPQMTATSIDYGIMEKAKNVISFPLDCGWDDVGSWTALEGLSEVLKIQQSAGTVASGEVVALSSAGNIIDAPGKLIALLGVDDLIIVENGDSLLVARKERAQDIKALVDQVKKIRPDLV